MFFFISSCRFSLPSEFIFLLQWSSSLPASFVLLLSNIFLYVIRPTTITHTLYVQWLFKISSESEEICSYILSLLILIFSRTFKLFSGVARKTHSDFSASSIYCSAPVVNFSFQLLYTQLQYFHIIILYNSYHLIGIVYLMRHCNTFL